MDTFSSGKRNFWRKTVFGMLLLLLRLPLLYYMSNFGIVICMPAPYVIRQYKNHRQFCTKSEEKNTSATTNNSSYNKRYPIRASLRARVCVCAAIIWCRQCIWDCWCCLNPISPVQIWMKFRVQYNFISSIFSWENNNQIFCTRCASISFSLFPRHSASPMMLISGNIFCFFYHSSVRHKNSAQT